MIPVRHAPPMSPKPRAQSPQLSTGHAAWIALGLLLIWLLVAGLMPWLLQSPEPAGDIQFVEPEPAVER